MLWRRVGDASSLSSPPRHAIFALEAFFDAPMALWAFFAAADLLGTAGVARVAHLSFFAVGSNADYWADRRVHRHHVERVCGKALVVVDMMGLILESGRCGCSYFVQEPPQTRIASSMSRRLTFLVNLDRFGCYCR